MKTITDLTTHNFVITEEMWQKSSSDPSLDHDTQLQYLVDSDHTPSSNSAQASERMQNRDLLPSWLGNVPYPSMSSAILASSPPSSETWHTPTPQSTCMITPHRPDSSMASVFVTSPEVDDFQSGSVSPGSLNEDAYTAVSAAALSANTTAPTTVDPQTITVRSGLALPPINASTSTTRASQKPKGAKRRKLFRPEIESGEVMWEPQ